MSTKTLDRIADDRTDLVFDHLSKGAAANSTDGNGVSLIIASIFGRLREILQKHAGALTVTADAPDHYCLAVDYSAKLKEGFPAAWVRIGKGYVSYHL